MTATIAISKIANSCIVNNANIAIQNENSTPLDATNNWWGIPHGASDQNRSAGDLVGQNVVYDPHLTIMPFLCDLADADWIPFNEQEFQNAINQNIPYLRGIGFALIDIEWGYGAKFTIVSKPDYGNAQGEAFISITPSPDGTLMTLMIDMARTAPEISQIAACELMPLFLNSLQQVQNRYVSPSQNIQQMVVMDSSIMIQFSPLTEITPEPAPEIVMNYDVGCLPPVIPPTPTPIPTPMLPQDENEGLGLITIPPIEGEFITLETQQQNSPNTCTGLPDQPVWCNLLDNGDVFTYHSTGSSFFVNRIAGLNGASDQIIIIENTLPNYFGFPSWGFVADNHYRFAYNCSTELPQQSYATCYWDNTDPDNYHYQSGNPSGHVEISPRGTKIAYQMFGDGTSFNGIRTYSLETPNSNFPQIVSKATFPHWSDDSALYYFSGTTPQELRYYDNDNIDVTVLTDNYLYFGFSVRLGDVLYWKNTGPGQYGLFRNSTENPILTESSPYPVYWSPNNINQYVTVHNQPEPGNPNRKCIKLYDISILPTIQVAEIFCGVISTSINWAGLNSVDGNIVFDLSFMLQTNQFTCLNPDPNATTADKINLCISELAGYGIIADASGLTQNWATQASFARAWTLEELQGIMAGVENTAKAFFMLKNQNQEVDKAIAKTLFNTVMGNFEILRVNNDFTTNPTATDYFDVAGCAESSFSACTSNTDQVITFYDRIFIDVSAGLQGISKYLMVHEMGHRFNARSDGGGGGGQGRSAESLYGRMTCQTVGTVTTCLTVNDFKTTNAGVVFGTTLIETDPGVYLGDWVRGGRGWGTGPHAPFNEAGFLPIPNSCIDPNRCRDQTTYITDFQQNSFSIRDWLATSDEREDEIDEVVADLFLNWVYYKSSNGQSGFKEWKWVNTEPNDNCKNNTGCPDSTNPGFARFNWMEIQMNDIFTKREW